MTKLFVYHAVTRVDGAFLSKCVLAPRGLAEAHRSTAVSLLILLIVAAAGFGANKVRALVSRYLGIAVEQVTDEVHFRNDFDLDSLNQLELFIMNFQA